MKKFILALITILAMLIPAYAKPVSKVDQLAHAIAKAEGFYTKGTVPNRFNNPGDITSSSRHAYPGQVGLSPHHHYVIFKNANYGWAALRGQIQKIIDGKSKVYKQNMTFAQITHIYVGAAGPWEKNWERNICSALGVTPRTTFQEFFELAPKVKYEINYSVLRTLASAQSGDRNAPRGPAQQLLASTGYSLRLDRKGLEMSGTMNGWYAYDLDGTAAYYEGWKGVEHIGDPVPEIIEDMKLEIEAGKEVRWFTARAWPIGVEKPDDWTEQDFLGRLLSAKLAVEYINAWSLLHLGKVIPVTCIKDFGMITLKDDRLIQIIPNTGKRADGKPLRS